MRVTFAQGTLAGAVATLLTACVTSNFYETNDFSAGTGVQRLSIDSKQRVVLISKRPDPDVIVAKAPLDAAAATNPTDRRLIFVTGAEPIPDALPVLSSSVSGSRQEPNVAATLLH
jgi:hypothetical protein